MTDAAILATLTAEARPAVEVAAALGYGSSSSLVGRIKRLNKTRGPLVEIVRDGRRLLLCLAAEPGHSVTEPASANPDQDSRESL